MKIGIFASVMLIVSLAAVALSGTYYVGDTGARLAALELDGDLNAMGNTITNASISDSTITDSDITLSYGKKFIQIDQEVDVRYYGVVCDGVTDNCNAIRNAINNVTGAKPIAKLKFPTGTCLTSCEIPIKRGIIIEGASTINDDGKATKIKLADHANTHLLTTPLSRSDGIHTHFMGIQNILFDGNKANQDSQNDCVQFWGADIGSWMYNVAIHNCNGTALSLSSNAMTLDKIWVYKATTNNYAMIIGANHSNTVSQYKIGELFIEYNNKPDGTLAKGLLINNVETIQIELLHQEGNKWGVDVNNSENIQILLHKWAGMGQGGGDAAVRLLTEPILFEMGGGISTGSWNVNWTFVRTNFSSSNFMNTTTRYYLAGYKGKNSSSIDYVIPDVTVRGDVLADGYVFAGNTGFSCEDLILYLPANGNTHDYSESNNSALPAGVNNETYTSGRFGSAFSMDGLDDVHSGSRKIQVGIDGFTVSTWLKRNDAANKNHGYLYQSGGESCNWNLAWSLAGEYGNKPRFHVYNGSKLISTPSSPIDLGTWNHVVGNYNTTHLNLYINGKLEGTSAFPYTPCVSDSTTGYRVGRYGSSDFTKTDIDEVLVFNRSLSEQEIQTLYSQTKEILGINQNIGYTGNCINVTTLTIINGIITGCS